MSVSFFHIVPFVSGLVFGAILVYFYKEEKITVVNYPKPYDKKIYEDKNKVKFQYVTKEVDCDKNEKNLKQYPLQ